MYIWRVENINGEGCYVHQDTKLILYRHIEDQKHPCPWDDILINRNPRDGEICGFLDLKQAINWFSEKELQKLKELGFELKLIKVKQITAIGNTQVLARR